MYVYTRSIHTWLNVNVFKSGKNVSRYKEVVIKGVKGGEIFQYNKFNETLF